MRKKNKMGWKPKQQKRLYVSSEDWNGDNVLVLPTAAFGTQKELSRPKDDCNVSNRNISNMIDQMKEAVDTLSQTEDFLLPWIVAEAELKALAENHDALKDGEEEVLSGGLDPNNAEHFMRGCSQIKEDLRDQRYDLALSRWNGLRIIFRESKNKKIRQLVFSYDIDVLKKLYFHSFFEY